MLVVLVIDLFRSLKAAHEACARAVRSFFVRINVIVEAIFVGILLAAGRALEVRYARLHAGVFGHNLFLIVVRERHSRRHALDVLEVVRACERFDREHRAFAEFQTVGDGAYVERGFARDRFLSAVYRDGIAARTLDGLPFQRSATLDFERRFCEHARVRAHCLYGALRDEIAALRRDYITARLGYRCRNLVVAHRREGNPRGLVGGKLYLFVGYRAVSYRFGFNRDVAACDDVTSRRAQADIVIFFYDVRSACDRALACGHVDKRGALGYAREHAVGRHCCDAFVVGGIGKGFRTGGGEFIGSAHIHGDFLVDKINAFAFCLVVLLLAARACRQRHAAQRRENE